MSGKKMKLGGLLTKLHQRHPEVLPWEQDQLDNALDLDRNVPSMAIKIFAIIGAWLAAGMFTTALAILEVFESEDALIIVGAITIIISLVLSHLLRSRPIFEPFNLTIGIVGQVMIMAGIGIMAEDLTLLALFAIFIEGLILLFTRNVIQRLGAGILICGAIFLIAYDQRWLLAGGLFVGLLGFLFTLVSIKEPWITAKFKKVIPWLGSGMSALAVSMVSLLPVYLYVFPDVFSSFHEGIYLKHDLMIWPVSLLMIASIVVSVNEVTVRHQLQHRRVLILPTAAVAMLPLIMAPDILAGLLLLVVSFQTGNIRILALGALAFIVAVISFYYTLHTTLLMKSLYMLGTGALFIAAWFGLRKLQPASS